MAAVGEEKDPGGAVRVLVEDLHELVVDDVTGIEDHSLVETIALVSILVLDVGAVSSEEDGELLGGALEEDWEELPELIWSWVVLEIDLVATLLVIDGDGCGVVERANTELVLCLCVGIAANEAKLIGRFDRSR